jgi:dTDP-4-dehydrorhamnose 3,5-epimerase
MKLSPLGIEGVWLAESPVWNDDRGSFREWFKDKELIEATGVEFAVQQANISISARGVLRGLHYSLAIDGQAKWITCVSGSVRDVVVDIRTDSVTFGKHVTVDLISGDGKAILIGKGLGHGFVSIENDSAVAYLVSSPFSPSEEFEINPLDPLLGISWGLPLKELRLSARDSAAPSLSQRAAQGKLPYL